MEKLDIKTSNSLLEKIALYKGKRRYTPLSSDLITTKDKDWLLNNMFSGSENASWGRIYAIIGVVIISSSILGERQA